MRTASHNAGRRRRWTSLTMLCLAALILWGCDQRQGFLPSPGGKPYEVLVVGDRDSLVAQSLSTDVECLPQPEPQFDVSTTDSAHFTGSLRLARAIVVVTVDDAAYTGFRMRYEKNVYAKPQIIVYIGAPDEATLCKGLTAAQGDNLRKLLNHFEANAQLLRLRHQRNIKAERRIRQMFGIDIWVPADMIASKEGPDFLWLSNNSATSMENLVIYRDWHKTGASQATHNDGTEASVGRFIATRDSILGSNIPGERDNMHVATVPGAVMVRADHLFFRGLWEMTHDDMGGPFVSRLLPLKEPTTKGPWTCQDIVAEGFVFAPGKSKRNAVRRLEAVLYSMKWAQDQDKSQGKERPKGNR